MKNFKQFTIALFVAIPLAFSSIGAKAGDIVFVAGEPMKFDKPTIENYVAAYGGQLGGRLVAVSAKDGKPLAEYKLDAPPVWDSLAAVQGKLFLCTADGQLRCFVGKEP